MLVDVGEGIKGASIGALTHANESLHEAEKTAGPTVSPLKSQLTPIDSEAANSAKDHEFHNSRYTSGDQTPDQKSSISVHIDPMAEGAAKDVESHSTLQPRARSDDRARISPSVVAAQCLSPSMPREVPVSILIRAKEIEQVQRQMISHLHNNGNDDNTSNVNAKHRNSITPGDGTNETNSCSDAHSGSVGTMGATGGSISASLATDSPVTTIGAKRGRRPPNLDNDALRRERQLTGPYSANPLLKKRGSDTVDDEMGGTERLPRIDSMAPGHFTPIGRNPSSTAASNTASTANPSQRVISANDGPPCSHVEKKARYMKLCSEIFDLLHQD